MVSLNRVYMLIAQGHTYGNLDRLKRAGFVWIKGEQCWKLKIEGHPMNNRTQLKKLQAMLNELEENGVRFISYMTDGAIK